MSKVAILSGSAGQQGILLSELLLSKGYKVKGLLRKSEFDNANDNLNLVSGVIYHVCEMTDTEKIHSLIDELRPDEIYNLAAMNSIGYSFEHPLETMDVNFGGFVRIVDAVRSLNLDCNIYHAASSEVYGNPVESPQNENTKHNPRNPYGISKCAGLQYAKICREKYGMKIYCGILYNNDSPLRAEEFLSKKVCKYVASVANGSKEKLKLGNFDARRDFGYSKEYCEWTWRIMQHNTPTDFVMATGITHSIKDFLDTAFEYIGINSWEKYIEVDETLFRPSEEKLLVGDATKSKELLSFTPKTTFKQLVHLMMAHELKQYEK